MDPEGNGGAAGHSAAAALPSNGETHAGRAANTGPVWPEPRRADGPAHEPDAAEMNIAAMNAAEVNTAELDAAELDALAVELEQSVEPDPGGMLIPRPGRGAERAGRPAERAGRQFAVLLPPERVEPAAPPGGSVPRLRWAGVMRVSGTRAVQLGRHLRAEIRFRYRVEQVPPARRAVDPAWPPMRDFLRGRDLGRPVTRSEFAGFRDTVRDRRAWPPVVPPLPVLRRSARSASGFEITGQTSVVRGDRNRVHGRQDLLVRRCAIRLGGLTRRDDRLTHDLFGAVRAAAGRLTPARTGWTAGVTTENGPWDGPPGSLKSTEAPEARPMIRIC